MRLTGKIGIVTAAASGIGRAGALRFAREGAHVAVVDVYAAGVQRVVNEITASGGPYPDVPEWIAQMAAIGRTYTRSHTARLNPAKSSRSLVRTRAADRRRLTAELRLWTACSSS